MCPKSFSVRIFLQDGHADGVKIIAKSKWPGRALVIPRSSLAEEKNRIELDAPGVYILVGQFTTDDLQTIYIGTGNPVSHALEQDDTDKEFWSWVVVFTSKENSLKQAHCQFFETRLLRLARKVKRVHLDNLKSPKLPELSVTELDDCNAFLDHILSLCPLLGLYAFENVEKS